MSRFSFKARIKSFKYAYRGILKLWDEHNMRIHIFFAIVAIILAWVLDFAAWEWVVLFLTIGFVVVMEAINSAIEKLCDFVCSEKRKEIGLVKDIAAGAVLLSAIISVVVGVILFLPKILTNILQFCN